MYYKEAVGALVVFDVTRVTTFEAVTKWKNDIDAKVMLPDGKAIPVVLLANKVRWARPPGPRRGKGAARAGSADPPVVAGCTARGRRRAQCDLAKEGLVKNSEQMNKFCEDKGFIAWCVGPGTLRRRAPRRESLGAWRRAREGVRVRCRFETSAKDNINIDKACRALVAKILENDVSTVKQQESLQLNSATEAPKQAGGCC